MQGAPGSTRRSLVLLAGAWLLSAQLLFSRQLAGSSDAPRAGMRSRRYVANARKFRANSYLKLTLATDEAQNGPAFKPLFEEAQL